MQYHTDKTQLQFYLFTQKDQLLQQFVQKHDLYWESNTKLFIYKFVVPISQLQNLQVIKKATKSVDVSLLYRSTHPNSSWATPTTKEHATHIEVLVRKKQLSREIRQQYIANKKYHYDQYMLYKDKLLSRTV